MGALEDDKNRRYRDVTVDSLPISSWNADVFGSGAQGWLYFIEQAGGFIVELDHVEEGDRVKRSIHCFDSIKQLFSNRGELKR